MLSLSDLSAFHYVHACERLAGTDDSPLAAIIRVRHCTWVLSLLLHDQQRALCCLAPTTKAGCQIGVQ